MQHLKPHFSLPEHAKHTINITKDNQRNKREQLTGANIGNIAPHFLTRT